MRLYLSSFRLGDHADRLRALVGERARIAVVANALDTQPPDTRRAGLEREFDDLAGLGLRPKELDLRRPSDLSMLAEVGAVWVRGGNCFVLRQALASSGGDRQLIKLVRAGRLVYAGFSAGPAVLAPSLQGLEKIDDVHAVRNPIWTGLGVLDRPFVPHVDSPGHPETADCDRLRAQLARGATPHWALRDGEVLLVEQSRTTVLPRDNHGGN